MSTIVKFILRSPLRAAIVCGLLVAVGFGLLSFPRPELAKTVSNWRIEDAILSNADQRQLFAARDAALAGGGGVTELTETEFDERNFAYAVSVPDVTNSAQRFVIRYVGADDLSGGQVFVAERELFAAPWWSPHRFAYKAARAEVDAFREVLHLTYERDVLGLTGLILIDGLVGLVYGLVVGLIVWALRGTGLAPSRQPSSRLRTQPFSPRTPLVRRKVAVTRRA